MNTRSITFKINRNIILLLSFVFILVTLIAVTTAGNIVEEFGYELLHYNMGTHFAEIEKNYKRLENLDVLANKEYVQKAQEDIFKEIKSYKFRETGYFYAVDSQKKIIYHPTLAQGTFFDNSFISEIIAKKKGRINYTYNGINKSALFEYFAPWDIYLILTVDHSDLFKSKDNLIKVIVSIMVLALFALVLFISFWIKKIIVRPLHEVTDNLKKAAQGEFKIEEKKSLKASSEIEELSATLKTMIANVVTVKNEIATLANAVANGKLTARGNTQNFRGEFLPIIENLNTLIENYNHVMTEVAQTVEGVSTGAQNVANMGRTLSSGAQEQASALEEISASMNEIGSQSKQNAENASKTNLLAQESFASANDGYGQMKNMVESMEAIRASSEEISKIIKVIDEIAFQTNLLALNAAVEAARAGKHGKGFAVVAQEVRNLAARSAKAAKETTEMIETSGKKVNDGNEIVKKTALSLDGILSSTSKVKDIVTEIMSSSNQQSTSVEQVVLSLNSIDKVTQKNAVTAKDSATSGNELSGEAMKLKTMLEKFQLS